MVEVILKTKKLVRKSWTCSHHVLQKLLIHLLHRLVPRYILVQRGTDASKRRQKAASVSDIDVEDQLTNALLPCDTQTLVCSMPQPPPPPPHVAHMIDK